MEQGFPCPDCGYVDGVAKPRTDTERELLNKGYVYDEGLGMYYLLEPGNENLRPSVTWYDPVTGKYEVVYDDAADSTEIYAEEVTPPSSDSSVLSNDMVTDFEVDLSAFEDIPEPKQPSQNTSSGIFGLLFGGEKEKKPEQYGDASGSSHSTRTRQNAVLSESDRKGSWLTPERFRWLALAGALVVIVLLFVLFYQLGRNSAYPGPTPIPPPSDEFTLPPSDAVSPTPFEEPTPDPTPSEDGFQTPEPLTPTPYTEPTATPDSTPTPSPTPEPTPTPTPTATPSPDPSVEDIVKPTPSSEDIPEPTDDPTDQPTDQPTDEPTDQPTDQPVDGPSDPPSDAPTPTDDEIEVV